MESQYPNSTERLVASALLLLLSSSPSIEKIAGSFNGCESLLSNKSSASSSFTIDEVSSDEAYNLRSRIVARTIDYSDREIELKVVKKSRSKMIMISDCGGFASGKQKFVGGSSSSSLSTEGSSCVTGGSSSVVSSSGRWKLVKKRGKWVLSQDAKEKKKQDYKFSSPHIVRRSKAILKVLDHIGCASEVRIRQFVGDSPTTSKALRMLLNANEVRRSGAGGKCDPYIYQISA